MTEGGTLFTSEQRELVRDRLVDKARADERIVAAALIGSSAEGGDRWSDLDLTFGVDDRCEIADVLSDWTADLVQQFDAAILFDLLFRAAIYRVFLLPGALQVDLSFAPASSFGAHGPRFELLFGEAIHHAEPDRLSSQQIFGLGIHHCLRAFISIRRRRFWQAEYWIHEARDEALALLCRRMGLPESHGRGFDDLPADIREGLLPSMVAELSKDRLSRSLLAIAETLLREAAAGGLSEVESVGPALLPVLQAEAVRPFD